jgi:hypothetical protein
MERWLSKAEKMQNRHKIKTDKGINKYKKIERVIED